MAVERIPEEFRRHDRAITVSDFRELAEQTPGAGVVRAETLRLFNPHQPDMVSPGAVSVVVWPAADPVHPDAAEDIARTEKLDPIDVEGNDEIARLARAFNAMLTALSASRDRQLKETFMALPTFESESQQTLARLTRFSRNANPLVTQLRPAARELSPTLQDLSALAPDAARCSATSTS